MRIYRRVSHLHKFRLCLWISLDMCEKSISKHGKTNRVGERSICNSRHVDVNLHFSIPSLPRYSLTLRIKEFKVQTKFPMSVTSVDGDRPSLVRRVACLGESQVLAKAHACQLLMLVIELVYMDAREGSKTGQGNNNKLFPSTIFH